MLFLGIILSYLLGSIPTAYIAGWLSKKIDIREYGSGNVGATNAIRILGKKIGFLVLFCDILKGLLAVTLLADLLGLTANLNRIILALVVISGHNWTIFLGFKGGKGIATGLGVLVGLAIKIPSIGCVLLGTVGIWLVCFLLTGYVSLASILAAAILPLLMLVTSQAFELTCLGIIFGIFVVLRHRPNLKRLRLGQEHRVSIFRRKRI